MNDTSLWSLMTQPILNVQANRKGSGLPCKSLQLFIDTAEKGPVVSTAPLQEPLAA